MQMKSLFVLLGIVGCTSILLSSCVSGRLASQDTEIVQTTPLVSRAPEPITSSIIPGKADWRIIKHALPFKIDLERIVLTEPLRAVVAITSDGRLFRGDLDTGTWSQISHLRKISFVDVAFLSENIGVAIGREIGPLSNTEAEYSLLVTADGGASWSTTFTTRSHVLIKLAIDQGLVIVVGGTWSYEPLGGTTHFVLRSLDLGKTWDDISDRLNEVARGENERVQDYSTAVKIDEFGKFYVLALHGRVYLGSSETSSFQMVADFHDMRAQNGFYQLRVMDNGSIWASGGAMSMEGYWGFIANASGDMAMSYRLDRHYFSDILVNSDNSIISVGSIIKPYDYDGPDDMIAGGIFFSENQGKEWSVLFKSDRSSEFTSIVQLSNSDYLAVGTKGEVVRLIRKF